MLDAKSRLDMVKLAIQGHPNYTVTDREIQKGGLSYTYLTINELKAEEPDTEFYFLMGADSLEDVKQIADELSLEYQGDFSLLKIPPTDISSTQIRKDIRMGNSISGKVPKAVEDYILIHRLYSQKQNTEG